MIDRLKRLTKKKDKFLRQLPDASRVLRASLVERYLTCGRANCRCSKGHKHGPFYYLSITLGVGKTKQIQIRPEQRALARQWIKNYRKTKILLEQISQINQEILQIKDNDTR